MTYNPIHANVWVAHIHMFFHYLRCEGCIIVYWYESAERIAVARHVCTGCSKLFWMSPGFIWNERYIHNHTVREPKTLWQLFCSSRYYDWLKQTKKAIETWKAQVEAEAEGSVVKQ